MKNRFLMLAFVVLAWATSVQAQKDARFEFGLKAGLSTSALQNHQLQVSGEGVDNLVATLKEADYGIQAGAFFRIPLGQRLFLQPEVTFNSSQASFQFNNQNTNTSTILKERYNHLNLPLLVGFRLGALKLQAGPVGHLYFEDGDQVFSREGWNSAMEEFNIGYALGGALDIGRITVDLRYAGNFSKFGQTINIGNQSYTVDEAAKNWIATVGFRF